MNTYQKNSCIFKVLYKIPIRFLGLKNILIVSLNFKKFQITYVTILEF
jgi:hypothetical protein